MKMFLSFQKKDKTVDCKESICKNTCEFVIRDLGRIPVHV